MELLQGNRQFAGLRLCNLSLKNAVLKAAWIFRTDSYSHAQLKAITPRDMGEKFWNCSLKPSDIQTLPHLQDVNPFWMEVTEKWFFIRSALCKKSELQNEILWFNSQIKVNHKVIYNAKAARLGLLCVKDLIDSENKLIKYDTLMVLYPNSMNWLEYNSLINAIPKSWIESMCTLVTNNADNCFEFLRKKPNVTAYMYNKLLGTNQAHVKVYQRFSKTIEMTEIEYQKAFLDLKQVTNITKYRDFQYRLLVNDIHTNTRLYYWGITNSQKCELCNEETQTIQHLMYECKVSADIWVKFQTFISEEIDCDGGILQFEVQNIFLNKVHPKPAHVINFLMLVVKQYIFAKKCLAKPIRFQEIIRKFKMEYEMEKFTATNTNKIKYHAIKWAPYTKEKTSP